MKEKRTKKKKAPPRQSSQMHKDMGPLNHQLGSFGLEPPKIYRNEQRQLTERAATYRQEKRTQRKTSDSHKTLQQKRREQDAKRRKSHKRRRILQWIVLILAIAAVLVVLSLTVLFKIDGITIDGNQRYTQEEIAAVLPIAKEKNLFLADTKGAQKKLEETLPYIYDVRIERKFPSKIAVHITETPTIYFIKNKDKSYTLLDDNFKVLEETAVEVPKKALEIRKAVLTQTIAGQPAVFSDEKQKANLQLLCRMITELQLKKITAVYSVDINNNFMVYDDRITYKFGTVDDLENKIYAALTATEQLAKTNPQAEGSMSFDGDKRVYFTEK